MTRTTDMVGKVQPLPAIAAITMAVAVALSFPVQAVEVASGIGPSAHKASPYRPVAMPGQAQSYYALVWGVDRMKVRQTASGSLIRFSYRVNDPARARMLGDKLATPYMFGQRSHALLQVPVMDKIGQLRQTGAQEAGKEYWMVFSNKGNFVRPGDRVNVIIGSVHVDGLLVE